MSALPDVNVLLALAWSNHRQHNAAHDWFQREGANGWATCLLTQAGFVRLSLNPLVVQVTIGCQTARDLLAGLVAHPGHQFLDAAPGLCDGSFDVLAARIIGYRQVSDATLLYLAHIHGMKLVTFDQGFASLCPWPQALELLTI